MKKGYILPLIILFSFVGVIALPSLLKKDELVNSISIEDIDFSFNKDTIYTLNMFICDNGTITIDTQNRLLYSSFEEKASIVLCSMVDCAHNSTDCPAWFGEENVYAVYYYKDKQYIISDRQNVGYDKVALYEANADGSERHRVHWFEYYSGDSYFCIDNMIYMFVKDEYAQFTLDIAGNSHETPQTTRIIAYNLDNGKFVEQIVCEQKYQQYYEFLGAYDGKVYYSYQYSTRPREEIRDENNNEVEGLYEESFRMGIGCMDVEGDENIQIISEGRSVVTAGLSNGILYWYTYDEKSDGMPNEMYTYNVESKLTDKVQVDVKVPDSKVRVVDGKLFFNYWDEEGFTVYDIQSGKATMYERDEYVIAEYNDYYLLTDASYFRSIVYAVKKDSLDDKDALINLDIKLIK